MSDTIKTVLAWGAIVIVLTAIVLSIYRIIPPAAATPEDAAGATEAEAEYVTALAESIVTVRVTMEGLGESVDGLSADTDAEGLKAVSDSFFDTKQTLDAEVRTFAKQPPRGYELINAEYLDGLRAARAGIDHTFDCVLGDDLACDDARVKYERWRDATELVLDKVGGI